MNNNRYPYRRGKTMSAILDKSWHLSQEPEEAKVTAFEFQLWRVFYGFLKWQEDCQQCVANETLSGYELALLHLVRMNEQPKTIYELSRLLNRDDPNNIQYGLGKLIKLGLIKKVKAESLKKALAYQITVKGKQNTDAYRNARCDILIKLFKNHGFEKLKIEEMTQILMTMKGIYDEACRLAASYKQED